MIVRIETTHDLAKWMEALLKGYISEEVGCLIHDLLQEYPAVWKKCQKCLKIRPATFYDEVLNNRDGLSHKCKDCRRKIHASNARRKRASKKISPEDLSEIQRHRTAAGLDPLPLGPDIPKPGRPKEK